MKATVREAKAGYPRLMKDETCVVLMDGPKTGMIISGVSNVGNGPGHYGKSWIYMEPFHGEVVLSS